MEEQQKLPEQPINFVFVPEAKILLTPQEFDILQRPLRMFEMAISVANMKNDELISTNQLVPVYKSDVDEKTGKLKDEKAFFDKYKPKEEKPKLTVDNLGNTN